MFLAATGPGTAVEVSVAITLLVKGRLRV